jgi:subtilisin-like proprotein convertase family protein
VGNEAIPLSGGVSDNHGLGNVEVCVGAICAPPDLTLTAPSASYVVDDRPAAPVPIHDGSGGTTVLIRTFTVTDTFTIGTVRLGLSAEHAHRDDLELVLRSPAGTEVRLLADDGDPGTYATGYSLLLDDAAPVPYHATQHDPVMPDAALAFDRTARPAAPLSAFTGEDPAGTWTVTLTDTDPTSHDGVYHGMRLILEPIPAQLTPRIGSWTRTIETEEPYDGVTRQAAVYATDLAGNRTAEPLALTFTVDNVPPVLTSTLLLDSAVLTPSIPVLTGRVNDGSAEEYGTPEVTVLVQAPGDTYRVPATQRGNRWSFDLQPSAPGRYSLLVSAVDAAGNIATVGPYTVEVREPLHLYMPVVARQHVAAPDLVVQAIHAAPHTIQVTILNRGSESVETPFWVDVYIDPSPPPDRVNQIWNTLSREGLVWAVTAPLQPGEELTLIPGDPYYVRAYSQVTWPLAVGTPVYAQVDSANATTPYGGVLENHEVLDWGYNNIAWCEVEVSQGLQGSTLGRSLIPFQDDRHLPRRR